jgi:hypothetical protein
MPLGGTQNKLKEHDLNVFSLQSRIHQNGALSSDKENQKVVHGYDNESRTFFKSELPVSPKSVRGIALNAMKAELLTILFKN